jgi:hypothetical protein
MFAFFSCQPERRIVRFGIFNDILIFPFYMFSQY